MAKVPTKSPEDRATDKVKRMMVTIDKANLTPVGASAADVCSDLMVAFHFTPKLRECDEASIFNALRLCKKFGLRVSAGPAADAWLIPYGRDCQLSIGSQAYVRLAMQNKIIKAVQCFAVYDGDNCRFHPGIGGRVEHEYGDGNPSTNDKITHVYAEFVMADGMSRYFWLTRDEIIAKHQNRAAANSDAWEKDWKEMAFKSVMAYPFNRGWIPFHNDLDPTEVSWDQDSVVFTTANNAAILDQTPARPDERSPEEKQEKPDYDRQGEMLFGKGAPLPD